MQITQYLDSDPWGDTTPENLAVNGMGGRETALINLGEAWAEAGHTVTQLVQVTEPYTRKTAAGGSITYASKNIAIEFLTNFSQDVLVSWEDPRLFAMPEIRQNIDFGCIEMQVAHLVQNEDGFDDFIDGYVCLSEWAGEFLADTDRRIDRRKISIIPNGVDLSRYDSTKIKELPPEGPYQFHYSSSPDRGLHHLLRMWPSILDSHPGSQLNVCYGVEPWIESQKWSHFEVGQLCAEVMRGLQNEGVNYHGKVGQMELASIQMESDLFLYPCDTMIATETGCISAVESCAAATPMVLTDCDCLESEFQEISVQVPLPLRDRSYLKGVSTLLENQSLYKELQDRGLEFAKSRSWEKISNTWLDYFSSNLS